MRKCSLSNLFQFCKINILDLSLCSSVENGGHIAKYQNVHKKKITIIHSIYRSTEKSQWRIQGGRRRRAPPYGPNFSQFHAVFRKIWHNHMLAPPPTGNPRSAPESVHLCNLQRFTTYLTKFYFSSNSSGR